MVYGLPVENYLISQCLGILNIKPFSKCIAACVDNAVFQLHALNRFSHDCRVLFVGTALTKM